MLGTRQRRGLRALATAVACAGAVIATAAPSGAVVVGPGPFDITCKAVVAGTIELDRVQTFDPHFDVPTEVFAGSTFTVTLPSGTTHLPDNQEPDGSGLAISEYKDLSASYRVAGGTLVVGSLVSHGTATINGNPVPGATADHPTPDSFRTLTPGPIPPGDLVTPDITFEVTAGAAGSTIELYATGATTTAVLPALASLGPAVVTCDFDRLVATISVVEPPPPGAPDAVSDVATTPAGTPVTIDVLANDKPNSDGVAPDPNTLAIVSQPSNGTAAVTADKKITYTPNSGFEGTDSFTYQVCVIPDSADGEEATPVCDVATVTVTVTGSSTTAGTGTQNTPTTTAAPTAAAELPRTGDASLVLALAGVTLLGAGALALRWSRRRAVAVR